MELRKGVSTLRAIPSSLCNKHQEPCPTHALGDAHARSRSSSSPSEDALPDSSPLPEAFLAALLCCSCSNSSPVSGTHPARRCITLCQAYGNGCGPPTGAVDRQLVYLMDLHSDCRSAVPTTAVIFQVIYYQPAPRPMRIYPSSTAWANFMRHFCTH